MKHCQQYFRQQNAFFGCGLNNKCMLYISIAAFTYSLALYISSYLAYVYVLGLTGAMFFDHDDLLQGIQSKFCMSMLGCYNLCI